ncbi:hypothetical protein MKEN_01267000 [Mycena kentingensis (nom. inval.)]|nr:hypothetical protein MKEN_01267000 [Mycena kentingensis (nom. inval.)]
MGSITSVLHQISIPSQLCAFTAVVGAVACFLVLALIAALYARSNTRPYLNRVSFRLVVYALVSMLLHAITLAVASFATGPSTTCSFTMWILMLALQFTSYLMFGIAINLQLVLVHGVSGRAMEKYYIIGATVVSLCVTLPPFATHQYGWDPIYGACWFTAADSKTRLEWQLGTHMIWTLLAAIGEMISFFVVYTHLHRHQVLYAATIRSGSFPRATNNSTTTTRLSPSYAIQYRSIIIRISLYPAVSIVMNILTFSCDLFISLRATATATQTDYNIAALIDFLYGLRPTVYAALAATDPALLRAIRVALDDIRGVKSTESTSADSKRSSVRFDKTSSGTRPSTSTTRTLEGRPPSRDFDSKPENENGARLDALRWEEVHRARMAEEAHVREDSEEFEKQI